MIKTSIGDLTENDFIIKAREGSLPENLAIVGDLRLRECTALTALPKGLMVGGFLYLEGCTALTALPEGLQVGWSLYIDRCTSLTELPEGLQVGWGLCLSGCTSLTALPSDLKVGDEIYADESFIQNYPFKEIPKILHLPFEYELKQLLLERLQ